MGTMTTYLENTNLEEKTLVNDQQAGQFLRRAREAAGWSRDKLIEEIEKGSSRRLHINTIYNMEERGQASAEVWAAVSEALGFEHRQPHIFVPKD